MKKIFVALFTLVSVSAFSLNLNIGLNMNQGSFNLKNGAKYDYERTTLGLQAELTQGFIIGDLGAGISYEPGYVLKDGLSSEFGAMPMYLIGRVNLFPVAIKPYLAVKVGTTLYNGGRNLVFDLKDGEFYAIAFGVTLIDMLQAEATYSIRTATLVDTSVTNSVVSLSLSYNMF